MNVKREKSASTMIFEALSTLIIDKRKEYNKLSVKEITDEAQLCRNSFYRNYKDIDDILLKKMEDVWVNTKIDEDIENYVGIEQVLYYYFSVIKNNERFFKTLYLANPGRYFDLFSKKIILSNSKIDINEVSEKNYYRYACRAWIGVGIMTEWLFRGFDLSIDEMIRLVMNAYKDW